MARKKSKPIESKSDDPAPPKKAKKKPSTYALHVKRTYHTPECLKLPVRQRLGYCAKLWHAMSDDEKKNMA